MADPRSEADRRSRSGCAWRGGAIALLATAAVACGEGVPAIDTEPGEAALSDVVSAAGFPETTFALLDSCPITDGQLLLERALADIDTPFVQLALDADEVAFVSAPNENPDGDPYVGCGRLAADGVGVLLTIADAPGAGVETIDTEFNPAPGDDESDARHDAAAAAYAARFGDPADQLSVERGIATRGGRFARICISEPNIPERDSCESAWFGGDLVVSTAVTGPGSQEIDIRAIEERFRPLLQLVVDGLQQP